MRSNKWLKAKRKELLRKYKYFLSYPKRLKRLKTIELVWAPHMGHLVFGWCELYKNRTKEIAINNVFRDERIPDQIVMGILWHELLHVFCSYQVDYRGKIWHTARHKLFCDIDLLNQRVDNWTQKHSKFIDYLYKIEK
jgi:hypothetical protein